MNILQVVPELNMGGVETGTVDLALSLVEMGHKAVVASSGGELVAELEKGGAKHYNLNLRSKSPLPMLLNIRRLEDIIRRENIDIAHARSRAPAWTTFFASRRAGVPFITTCHGYYSRHPFSYVMGWGKTVIVPSEAIGRHEREDFAVPLARIRHIPRSLRPERFDFIPPKSKPHSHPIVGIIGRLTPLKGHSYFLRAMAKVVRDIRDLEIWIVGDVGRGKEHYRAEIEILVKRLGLSPYVKFLGRQKDIPGILNQLNLLVISTITEEAFGRVVIEAQAAGVPVVGTRVGGISEIISPAVYVSSEKCEIKKTGDVCGMLVPARDIPAMSYAIKYVLRNKEFADDIARAGRRYVEQRFGLNKMVSATLDVYRKAQELNILVIKLSAAGDVILSTPSLRALRRRYPRAKIVVLTSLGCAEILNGCPYLDNLVVYDFPRGAGAVNGLWQLGKKLRRECFDVCLDLQNNKTSHILSFLSFARRRYGYDNGKLSFLLNRRVRLPTLPTAPVKHQSHILRAMGVGGDYDPRPELWPSSDDEAYIRDLLAGEWLGPEQKLVGINVSSSQRWPTKRWPQQAVAKLCDLLISEDIRVVLTGTTQDLPLAREIFRASRAKPIIACGRTSINQLACLIKRCAAYVSGDSASLHIASAMGRPFVALFGPTDPQRHLPPGERYKVIRRELSCSPCYKKKCPQENPCMRQIGAQEVFVQIRQLL